MPLKHLFILGGVVAALVGGFLWRDTFLRSKLSEESKKALVLQTQAKVLYESGLESKKSAIEADKKVAEEAKKTAEAEKTSQILKNKVKTLQSQLQKPPEVGDIVDPVHLAMDNAKDDYIEALEYETESQKQHIQALETSVTAWKLSSDAFEAAYKRSEEAFVAQRIATETAQKTAKTALWKGRMQGFGAGALSALLYGLKK